MERMKVLFCTVVLTVVSFSVTAQSAKQQWVDSVFQTLDQNEKIGQLFFTRFSSHVPPNVLKNITKAIAAGDCGGVIFTSGTTGKQARVTLQLQGASRVPLLIAQDASGGLGHLLDSALRYPLPIAQGALANDSLVYWIARETGRQMKAMGIHMSLSPNALPVHSATTNSNWLYGDNPDQVAQKALLHMKGLRDAGVLSCAKYFPLKSIEVVDQKGKVQITLYHDPVVSRPFRSLFGQGLNAVIPDVTDLHRFFEPKRSDLKKKLADSTFNQFETGDILHQPIGYNGVIIADAHAIELTSDKFEPGDAALLAFQAGADVIIAQEDTEPAFRKIKKLLHSQKAFVTHLDQRVKKILAMKYDAGLASNTLPDLDFLQHELQTTEGQLLRTKALRESITVVRNEKQILPVRNLEDKTFACLLPGDSSVEGDIFYRSLKKYVPIHRIVVGERAPEAAISGHDVIIVSLFPGTSKKVLQNIMGVLQEVAPRQQVIIADFGCAIFEPYASRFPAVMVGYDDEYDIVGMMPQVIFGGLPARGILPVQYANIPSGTQIPLASLDRLAYSYPEDAGIDGAVLQKIGDIAQEAISSGSTPGCYVLVAKDGKVVYDHAFGHLTYDRKNPVTDETIYDLASLTKVAATLQAIMFMQERDAIDLYKKLSVYLPELKGTNKKNITLIDILTHQSGLAPFVPLWPLTVEGPAFPMYYSSQQNVRYPLQVSPTLFGSPVLKDSVWSWITYSKMLEKPKRTPYTYRYSDLGFMMFKQLAERTLNQPLEDFLQQNIYDPLGATTLGYTPLDRFPAERIAPTELDTLFRHGLLIGTVHDERAAMLGGVSGHAGLFGTANDLSKLAQMLLQEGTYGGLRYYKPETVRLFTAKQFALSRRGIGWDKPVQGEWNSPTSRYASPATFGHTGFTGTCMWVDPEFDLVYIFLSNRVFPDRSDKLIQTNIRSRIQDVIYEAIFNFCKTHERADFEGKSYFEQ